MRHMGDAGLDALSLGHVLQHVHQILRHAVVADDRQPRRRHQAGAVAGRLDRVHVEEFLLACRQQPVVVLVDDIRVGFREDIMRRPARSSGRATDRNAPRPAG